MKSRLIIFLILFALILGTFEIFVRVNGEYFFSLSDRVLLKTAILERSTDTPVLFIGTSRFLDGIDQGIFSDALKKETGQRFKCFNGATAGIQGARFAYFAEMAAKKETLTHVILEMSPPALHKSELNFPDQENTETITEDPESRFATRFENRLQNWVSKHVGLVKYRKAMRPKTLLKLVVLYSSDFIDPAVWSRKGGLRNLFPSDDYEVTDEHFATIRPEIIKANSIKAVPDDFEANQYYEALEKVSKVFSDSGIKIIWVAPPVSIESRDANHGPQFTAPYQVIAHQYGSTFYDYTGVEIDPGLFRDPGHLNEEGRKIFSTVLAKQLAGHFVTKPTR